jgi:hypothetical protein
MIDANLIFDGTLNPAAGVAITTSRASTNVLDLLAGRDIGAGLAYDQEIRVDVMQNFAGVGASLQVQVQEAPDNGAGAPGTYYTIAETDAIVTASLLALGRPIARYSWPVIQANYPAGDAAPPRFLRLNYVVAAGPFTGGSVLAYLNADRDSRVIYKANFVVA